MEIVTIAPQAPITHEFPFRLTDEKDIEARIPNPSVPRASQVLTKEEPSKAPAEYDGKRSDSGQRTVLQQHIDFFDTDHDGVIYPWDTIAGFRRMGYSRLFSTWAGPAIHSAMSLPTQRTWFPDPRLPIYIDNIHKAKHGSDSGVYDFEGRFVPQKFEEIFMHFDKGDKGALTWDELQAMVSRNKVLYDGFGAVATRAEWGVTWALAAKDGLLSKEDMAGQYDGSLFYRKAAEFAAGENKAKM